LLVLEPPMSRIFAGSLFCGVRSRPMCRKIEAIVVLSLSYALQSFVIKFQQHPGQVMGCYLLLTDR